LVTQLARTTWYPSSMQSGEYVVGRLTEGGEPVGEAHAVAIEVARGTNGFWARCGKQMDVVPGGSWPPREADAGGPCPVCVAV
jgi:hypothetical protein